MKRWQELEKAVEDLLKAKGLRYMHLTNYICYKCHAVQNAKATGHPDFEIYYPHFYVECKTGTGELTDEQKEVRGLIEKSAYYIVARDNIDEVDRFLNLILPQSSVREYPKKPKRRMRRVLV